MKLFVFVVVLAAVVLADLEQNEIENDVVGSNELDLLEEDDASTAVSPRFILSWGARRQLRKLRKQMACGFPDQGIPPLAPYRQENLEFELKSSIIETLNDIFHFKVDGLDNFKIKKFNLNIIKSRVQFNFLFKKIRVTGKYNTDTFLNLMNELGVSVRYEGKGDLDFSLQKLSISGNLKYKLPVLFGSAKITEFYALVSLEKCKSNTTGLGGDGKYNRFLNDKLEDAVVSGINGKQELVSAKIEEFLVPRVNKALKGTNFWDIWNYIFHSDSSEEGSGSEEEDNVCIPPPDPWA